MKLFISLLLALALLGCGDKPTEVPLEVDSSLTVGGVIDLTYTSAIESGIKAPVSCWYVTIEQRINVESILDETCNATTYVWVKKKGDKVSKHSWIEKMIRSYSVPQSRVRETAASDMEKAEAVKAHVEAKLDSGYEPRCQ